VALRISVFNSKELQGTIVALKRLDKELAKQIRRAVKALGQPEWQQALAKEADTERQTVVLVRTARVAVSNQNVTLSSATVGRSLQGGAKPSDIAHSDEFGADRDFRRGKRHTRRQFKPRNRKGYVVYPAAASFIPRMASLFVATTVRTAHEAFERKTGG
jgi:hypothetical protein